MKNKHISKLITTGLLTSSLAGSVYGGSIARLFYDDAAITGANVDEFRASVIFPNGPTFREVLDDHTTDPNGNAVFGFQGKENTGVNYGSFMRGYIQIPEDGDYTFYISSDDAGELWISPDTNPANAEMIGIQNGCCDPIFEANRLDERSGTLTGLTKGSFHYIEAYQVQGGGGAYVQVGWMTPDGTQEIIPARHLIQFYEDPGIGRSGTSAPTFNAESLNGNGGGLPSVVTTEGLDALMDLDVIGSMPMTFAWTVNGEAVDNPLSYFMVEQTPISLNGATVAVTVSNSMGSISSSATLTVNPDTVAPSLVSARGSGMPAGIIVAFSEAVDVESATDASHYSISGQDVTVESVSMLSDRTVLLSVSEYNTDDMTLTVTGVTDLAASPNAVPAGSSVKIALAQTLLAYWDFNDSATTDVAVDSAGGHTGEIRNAMYTFDAGGFTGNAGDTAMDVAAAGAYVYVDDATFLNASGASNQMSVSFWQKNNSEPASSSYWMFSPSSNNGGRGNQAHVPWSNRNIYFDTDGCCDGTQRINGAVDAAFDFLQWHHYVFVKNGDNKEIWIDGELFLSGVNTGPFPSDFESMTIGSATNGGNSADATIDDFSIFSVGLTADEIAGLADSGNPADLSMPLAGALSITAQPESQTLDELLFATFSVTVEGGDPSVIGYQWYRDGEAVAGATSASYTFGPLTIADDGAMFKVMAFNTDGTFTPVESDEVTLSVTSDVSAPAILNTKGKFGLNGLMIEFDEALEVVSAETVGNYSIEGLTVTGATLDASGLTVTLDTSAQTPGTTYTVVVNGVTDIANGANATADATDTFIAWVVFDGNLRFEAFTNITGTAVANLTGAAKFPNNPDDARLLTSFDTPNSYGELYGARVRGWFVPAVTGEYAFFLLSDDASQLFFNPNGEEEVSFFTGAEPIARQDGCCGTYVEEGNPQTSARFSLTAGQAYYIEGLLKEGGGGDYLRVAYRLSTDFTPAAELTPIDGSELRTQWDINAEIEFTMQPEDQLAILPEPGDDIVIIGLGDGDGSFTVTNSEPAPPNPWEYDATLGAWKTLGGGTAGPYHSMLRTPEVTAPTTAGVSLVLKHRYFFEAGLYDAGQLRVSINGGEFVAVPTTSVVQNGYTAQAIIGNGIMKDDFGFNGKSAGYDDGINITTTAILGLLNAGDTVAVEFLGAWDEGYVEPAANWIIEEVGFFTLPLIDQNFGENNGGYSVVTEGPVPGPWMYNDVKGVWYADGAESGCTGPYWSFLNSPSYGVAKDGEVQISVDHRYSFEGDLWDGGQIRVSINGGDYVEVPAEAFSQNGYAEGLIQGAGILNGLSAFNAASEGYGAGEYITSVATVGTFVAGDSIQIQFLGGWDNCTNGGIPNWEVKSISSDQLVLGSVPVASTFTAEAVATQYGATIPFSYQWQRDDGNGFVDILDAIGASYSIYPQEADLDAVFRVVASIPGVDVNSETAKLVLTLDEDPPMISLTSAEGVITIEYTGTLEAAMSADGTFAPVDGATSPYTPAGEGMMMFYRSSK